VIWLSWASGQSFSLIITSTSPFTFSQAALEFEAEQYHDIVQEDFQDTYHNLTYKGIAGLKWISYFCPHARFILKTDDDIFVNTFTLFRHLRSFENGGDKNMTIMCLVWKTMKVSFYIRQPSPLTLATRQLRV
jgi:hypothetical protein